MWLFTRAGFFSVVDKDENERGEGEVCIRARIGADFTRLRDLYFPDMPEIVVEENTDYPYRIYVNKKAWAKVTALMTEDIDYANFKGMVAFEQGYDRSHLYGEVWSVMFNSERRLNEKQPARRHIR